MKRTELAEKLSEKYELGFEEVLRKIDAAMDDEYGVEVDEVPLEFAKDCEAGIKEEAEYRNDD